MDGEQRIIENPEVLIIGGGIVGTSILRECAKNGVSAQLVERGDFGWDISAGSTEMAHGGFRYLMALADWPLVFESLTERELLSVNAPHLVRHLNFYMPVYKGDGTTFDFCIPHIPKMPITIGRYFGVGMWMMQMGMLLYKLFAAVGLKLKGFPPNWEEIGYKKYNQKQMLDIAPQLETKDLVGGFRFTDCKIEDVERLITENILSARQYAEKSGTAVSAANYVEAVAVARGAGGAVESVETRDVLTGEKWTIRPKYVVNSTGIFIDEIIKKAGFGGEHELIRRVSGIHLIVPRFWNSEDRQAAFAFWLDKKILFAISKGTDRILIGTTERDIDLGDGNHNRTFADDVKEIVKKTARRFPGFKFDPEKDIYYTRVRPLMHQASKTDPKAVSRRDLVKWHTDTPNVVSVSGKLGPARHLGQTVGVGLVKKLRAGKKYEHTHRDKLPGGNIEGGFEAFMGGARAAHPEVDPRILGNMIRRYGTRYEEVLKFAGGPRDLEPICGAPDSQPMCALVFAFEKEFCRKMSDAMTRTGNTKFFGEGLDAIDMAAKYAGEKLGWDAARVETEIRDYRLFMERRKELVGNL
jgi:glycerol-3-phosphate dehydrogenase